MKCYSDEMPITRQHKQYERKPLAGKLLSMRWEDNLGIVNKEGDELSAYIYRMILKREKVRKLKRAAKKRERKKRKIEFYAAIAGIKGLAKMRCAKRFEQKQQNRKRRNERK